MESKEDSKESTSRNMTYAKSYSIAAAIWRAVCGVITTNTDKVTATWKPATNQTRPDGSPAVNPASVYGGCREEGKMSRIWKWNRLMFGEAYVGSAYQQHTDWMEMPRHQVDSTKMDRSDALRGQPMWNGMGLASPSAENWSSRHRRAAGPATSRDAPSRSGLARQIPISGASEPGWNIVAPVHTAHRTAFLPRDETLFIT
nr:hypothetical protein CFP56_70135 [Quercus suber]